MPIKVVLISIKTVLLKQTNLMDYYYSLTAKSNLNITAGNTNSYQDYNSSIYQLFDNGTHNLNNPDYINDVQYRFNDAYLGVHYKFITGKFTFNPGFSIHQYNTNNAAKFKRTILVVFA
jgi:hypothetical protein